jgi:hypothetical protein
LSITAKFVFLVTLASRKCKSVSGKIPSEIALILSRDSCESLNG